MTIIIVCIIMFAVMLFFPVGFSLIVLRKTGGDVLVIQHKKARDARYFVKSFTRMFDKKWRSYDGSGKIKLSRVEKVIEADSTSEYPSVCDSIVFAENLDFRPPSGVQFEKEVYANKDAYIFGISMIRAICSKKNILLGDGTEILRWVDAEGILYVYDDCNLGISASSKAKITLGKNCTFRRLYAPAIFFGKGIKDDSDINDWQTVNVKSIEKNVIRNIKYVDDSLANEDGILSNTIITKYTLRVLNKLIVKGHIRSHKSVRICDNAMVYGNIFAEEDIYLGRNSRVFGSILSQQNIYIENGAIVGQYSKIKSVIARGKITCEKNCCVYGYVGSETYGECCPAIKEAVFEKEESSKNANIQDQSMLNINAPRMRTIVNFPSVSAFDKLVPHGFRKNEEITEVTIPHGVTHIPSGFFYRCKSLHRVVLPSTIEEIGDFAFYNCGALADMDLSKCRELRSIGESAFEGCSYLMRIKIPCSCSHIKTSAFCGCGIEQIVFECVDSSVELGSHVFMNCKSLLSIDIPKTVTAIKTSAFYGCSSLEELVLPKSVKHIGNYAFYKCESLSSLKILSYEVIAKEFALKGLPDTIKIWFENPSIADLLSKKE